MSTDNPYEYIPEHGNADGMEGFGADDADFLQGLSDQLGDTIGYGLHGEDAVDAAQRHVDQVADQVSSDVAAEQAQAAEDSHFDREWLGLTAANEQQFLTRRQRLGRWLTSKLARFDDLDD